MKRTSFLLFLIFLLSLGRVVGQQHTENKADQVLRGSGRVNASSLGMEIDIPLGSYPGRGINIPVNLSYSSKVWRMEYVTQMPGVNNPENCRSINNPMYAENSAAGWTTSMAVPYIEYTGFDNPYNAEGYPAGSEEGLCLPEPPPPPPGGLVLIKRISIRLPNGETHELRDASGNAVGNFPESFDGTYYAVDGSNIKFVQQVSTGIYRLQMPDGSHYDLASTYGPLGLATIRKAVTFTDRNGNFTSYNEPTTQHPNGYWTDTLGKIIEVPFGLSAPSAPTTQTYAMPGMTSNYTFRWKKLKNTTAAESALTDFDLPLKYWGDKYLSNGQWQTRPFGESLFISEWDAWVIKINAQFNPVVLTDIELPTGQKYTFTYDVYGRIERIYYPTGAEERFEYAVVAMLGNSDETDINAQTNFGVVNRQLYVDAGQGPLLEWTYSAQRVASNGYKVTTTMPDLTTSERFLHRSSLNVGIGTFGFDTVLAGMPYEETTISSTGHTVGRKLTTWTFSEPVDGREWHPRVDKEESRIYDLAGNGISATATFEYEGNLSLPETPVLMRKSSQYGFVAVGAPLPSNPVKVSESTFLISDPNYAGVKSYYTAQNMIALVTASQIKDGAGTVVSRNEMVYDESGRSPGYRGNPTSLRVWDSTKGLVTNTSAYISTSARFDTYGNQYESTDAKGNTTTTTFDPTHHAFPIEVTSPVPDPSNTHGSNSSFVTAATFNYETGLPLTNTDANGLETRIEYDPVTLRPLNTKTYYDDVQVGSTAETIYHDEPNNYWVKNRTQIDENKWAETITYFDGLGRAWKTEEVNSNGNIFVEKEFDAEGRVKRVSNPFRENETKYWTTNVYDEASRVKEVTLQDGATIKTDYGVSVTAPIGVTKQITDQAGKKRKGISDALGRMIRVVEDPSGQALNTDYVFDTLGNLRKTTQGVQNRYFMHDSLGRLLYAKQPEQDTRSAFVATDPVTGNTAWSVKYVYDDNSNITSTTDARNVSVTATYDNLNRLKVRDYSDTTPDVSFYYDGRGLGSVPAFSNGKTTKVTSSVSETRYTSFDNLGRLLTHQQITDGQTYNTAYTYNLSGALVEETYPSGRVVRNTLDQNGDLSQVQSKKNANYGFFAYAKGLAYDSAGNVKKMQLGNGRWETSVYNNRLQITQIGLGTTDVDQNQLKLELSYGANTQNNGSLREQKITVPGIANPFIQTYTYDDLNRLQVAEEKVNQQTTWKQTFTIDRYGNREIDAANTTTLGSCPQVVCNPDISPETNRLVGYGFDANGNVTQDAEGKRFGYDAENHQKEFFVAGNSSTDPDATHSYDGDGRRVKKISSTETTVFVYNASGQLVAEYSTQISQTPQVSYLTTDHLGSPRVITDQLGAVKDRKDFSAFGEESISAQRSGNAEYTAADQLRKNYTGYEKDTESGLEFAQARYYNPTHGRFTSVDPLTASASIRNPQTFNRYAYVLNSPYKFVDPLGLISETTGACGSRCPGSGPYVDGSAFRGRDASFAALLDSLIPAFDWSNLTADEQRIFNNSSIQVVDQNSQTTDGGGCLSMVTHSGQDLFKYMARNNPTALAGTLNQTAQLAGIKYIDNMGPRNALSLVNSIQSLEQDRAVFTVAPALKHFISDHDDFSSATGHGESFPDSWKQNKPPYAGAQLSFSRDGRFLEVDTDYSNIKNRQDLISIVRGIFGHGIEVADNHFNKKKTDPYVVYGMLTKRGLKLSYSIPLK